jgi:hypothetical protein
MRCLGQQPCYSESGMCTLSGPVDLAIGSSLLVIFPRRQFAFLCHASLTVVLATAIGERGTRERERERESERERERDMYIYREDSREKEEIYICSSRLGLIKMDHHHSGNGRNSLVWSGLQVKRERERKLHLFQ